MRPIILVLLACCTPLDNASAQTEGDSSPVKTRQELEAELQALEQRIDAIEKESESSPKSESAVASGGADVTAGAAADPGEKAEGEDESGIRFTPFYQREELDTPRAFRDVYEKPFLASLWRKAYLGGYTELEYHSYQNGTLGTQQGFRMHRTNLFLFTEITDRIRFAGEIEFESEADAPNFEAKTKLAVEMAFVDWKIFEEFVLRGGAILSPLGRVNQNHDGPVRELTDRPMVSRFIIPTTMTDAGVGALGTFDIHENFALSYEAYAVNGFNMLNSAGEIPVDTNDIEKIIRKGRTKLGGDSNSGIAGTGRLSLQTLGILDLGASFHTGTYDTNNDNLLTIVAGDYGVLQPLGESYTIGLQGEVALASFERNAFAQAAGIPGQFWGTWVEATLSGMPPSFRKAIPYIFDESSSSFTLVLRYDYVDLDGDIGDAIEPGINFRPVADTVLKFSYRIASRGVGMGNLPGRENWNDSGFIFSLTSYF